MTKKDYELIARGIKGVYMDCEDEIEQYAVSEVARSLSIDLQDDNPRFDRNKFLTACGIED